MKYLISLLLLVVSSAIHADGFYVEIGAYIGSTDYKIDTGNRVCTNPVKHGCFNYENEYKDINGPFGKAEFGYEYGNASANCFHLSSMSTSKDAGMKLLCGGSYRFK